MSQQAYNQYPVRELFAKVRAKLDAAGHTGIDFDPLWVNDGRPDHAFSIDVPIGAEHVLPLLPLASKHAAGDDAVEQFAETLALTMRNLRLAERSLVRYAESVRRAARVVVAAARAKGLDVMLEGVELKPTLAFHLAGTDWRAAATHVLALVRIRHTSDHLQRVVSDVVVEEPAHVAEELGELLAEQRERQDRLRELSLLGADLVVEAITVDILRSHDVPVEQTLREVWKTQCVNIKLTDGRNLSVISSNGVARCSVDLGGALWNGQRLWFSDSHDRERIGRLSGRPLGDLVPHPAFRHRIVYAVEGLDRNASPQLVLQETDNYLFDARSGRLWSLERQAA